MFSAAWQYVRTEVKPRLFTILVGSDLIAAVAIGVAVWVRLDLLPFRSVRAHEVGLAILTYAAIALGFSLAGLTLALTLPDREFARTLANSKPPRARADAYSDLLFVFSWTAIWHWIAVIVALSLLIAAQSTDTVGALASQPLGRLSVAALVFIVSYGLFRFLITLITLSQVGSLYIRSLSNKT